MNNSLVQCPPLGAFAKSLGDSERLSAILLWQAGGAPVYLAGSVKDGIG